jgi:hypothetical protein
MAFRPDILPGPAKAVVGFDGKENAMIRLISCCLLPFVVQFSFAQEARKLGVGFTIADPVGINMKVWTSSSEAVNVSIGWTHAMARVGNTWYYDKSRIHLIADYLWHDFQAFQSKERVPLYYGVGARFSGPVEQLGIRGVLGIAWMPRTAPVDIFLEIAPVLYLAPMNGVGFDTGLGFRFYP